jgi:putative transcriptional regulator
MTITHHPPAELLAEFASGKLDQAQHLVVAVHTAQCPACRRFIRAMEQLAGAALEDAAPVPLAPGSFEAVMVRARKTPQREVATQAPAPVDTGVNDGLPDVLRRLPLGKRRWVAPGVSVQPILLTGSSKSGSSRSRSFLLRSAPGTQMLEHSHSGNELTCVLKGTFSHSGGTFNPGDFDFGDEAVDHRPTVGGTEPCLCVVAMTGNLQMNGFLGRLISPFIRL